MSVLYKYHFFLCIFHKGVWLVKNVSTLKQIILVKTKFTVENTTLNINVSLNLYI